MTRRRARSPMLHPRRCAAPCSVMTTSTSARAVVTMPPSRRALIVERPRKVERTAMIERLPVSAAARVKSTWPPTALT